MSLLEDSRDDVNFLMTVLPIGSSSLEPALPGLDLSSRDPLTPSMSPDGSKVAFVRDGALYTADLLGNPRVEALVDEGQAFDPAWSPDGSMLAFEWFFEDGRTSGLYVVDADGSDPRLVTTDGGSDLTWSPNGERIAFSAPTDDDDEFWDVYSVALDGSDLRNLTNTQLQAETEPSWSWATNRIAFEQWSGEEGSDSSIRTMAPDGTDVRVVSQGNDDRFPVWSPDGEAILFVEDRLSLAPRLVVIRRDGSDRRVVFTFRAVRDPVGGGMVGRPDGSGRNPIDEPGRFVTTFVTTLRW